MLGMLKEGEGSAQTSAQRTTAPTQGTKEGSSAHGPDVRADSSWGKRKGRD